MCRLLPDSSASRRGGSVWVRSSVAAGRGCTPAGPCAQGTASFSGGMPPHQSSAPQLACLMHSRRRGSASAGSLLAWLLQTGRMAAGIMALSASSREEDNSDICRLRWPSWSTCMSTNPLQHTSHSHAAGTGLDCLQADANTSQHTERCQEEQCKQPGAPPPGGRPVPVQHGSRTAAPQVPPAARAGPLQHAGSPLLLPSGAGPAAAAGGEPHPCRQGMQHVACIVWGQQAQANPGQCRHCACSRDALLLQAISLFPAGHAQRTGTWCTEGARRSASYRASLSG